MARENFTKSQLAVIGDHAVRHATITTEFMQVGRISTTSQFTLKALGEEFDLVFTERQIVEAKKLIQQVSHALRTRQPFESLTQTS